MLHSTTQIIEPDSGTDIEVPLGDLGISRIVVTSDLLRVDDQKADRLADPNPNNVDFLNVLIGAPLARALSVSSLSAAALSEPLPSLRLRIFRMHGLPVSMASWARLYAGLSAEGGAEIARLFKDALVVGYELPPYMVALLREHQVPFVDFSVSPIRFLPDYIFAVRTNVTALRHSLSGARVPQWMISREARLLTALGLRRREGISAKLPKNAVLFIGQADHDNSMIANGRMADDIDVRVHLQRIADRTGQVCYKRHPYRKNFDGLGKFIENDERMILIDHNIYELLGSGLVQEVHSLSSGVLHEARYFGVTCTRVLPVTTRHCVDDGDPSPDEYFGVLPHVLEEGFWTAVAKGSEFRLEDAHLRLSDAALKQCLSMQWGR